jgi:uncharacterized protein (DUF58 family)
VLTRQGWLVGIGAGVLLLGGRVLGLFEVFALGVVALVLLVGSLVLVRASRLQLEVGRVIHPARVHVGQRSRVDLSVRNRRGRRTPVLRLRDPVSGTRGADLLVPPLAPSERSVAAYRLPTDRRGIVEVGPLEVVVSDPFGLVDMATDAAPEVRLTVLPHVDHVQPMPYTSAHDPQAGIRQLNSLGRTGEEFYALRPFTVGDDLRRVHWPSSARLDELMIRQNELPWQGRTTVLLDVRDATHRGDSIEVAVSAAASVVAATARRQDLVRLVTTSGSDSDFAPGAEHVHALMEHLAVVPTDATADLHRSLDALTRRAAGGALVAIVADVPLDDVRALQLLRSRFGSVTVVQVDRSAWDVRAAVGHPAAPEVVHVTRDVPFAAAWDRHVRQASDGRARVGSRVPR